MGSRGTTAVRIGVGPGKGSVLARYAYRKAARLGLRAARFMIAEKGYRFSGWPSSEPYTGLAWRSSSFDFLTKREAVRNRASFAGAAPGNVVRRPCALVGSAVVAALRRRE